VKKVTANSYQKDKLYPAVARCVAEMLETGNTVTTVEVLLRLQRITKQQYEDWRFGRIPYLERVCLGNLSKLNRLLRILDHHARARGLTPSSTVYRKWGRGGKRIVLRFSKSGDARLEAAYSRCYHANAPSRPQHAQPAGLVQASGVEPDALQGRAGQLAD
jgi:hypothetical protein